MTTKVLKLLVIAVSITISALAQSQASCQALVQQGIYDTFSSSTNVSDYSQFISQFCNSTSQGSNNQGKSASSVTSSNQDSSDNTETTSVKVSVFGISGEHSHTVTNDESSSAEDSDDGQFSSSQMAALVQFMCSSANSQSDSAESLNQLSQVIDPNVISAYEECLAATASGLQTSTTIRQDQCQMTIQVNYVPPVGANATITIDSIEINPSGAWECSGSLWDLVESNATLDTSSVAMSCTRNVSETPFTFQNVLVFAEPSSIIINAASNVILRNFSSIPAKNLPEDDISSVTQAINQLKGFLTDLSDAIQSENDAIQGNLSSFSASLQNFSAVLNDASSSLSDLSDEIAQQHVAISNLQDYTQLDIAETCYNFTLAETLFCATCNYTSEPGAMYSCWDLAYCVGVLNEQFICIPGVPSVTIENILTIEGTILSGYLPNLATADLSNFYTNRNGRLECECEMN